RAIQPRRDVRQPAKVVPQDYAKARKWWRLAAQQGDADAQYSLGQMYDSGHDVPQNYVKAYKWVALSKVGAKPGSSVDKNVEAAMSA
ncbi:Sel1 domain protein repeat-containing protein, partial [mine drainage metagenome]